MGGVSSVISGNSIKIGRNIFERIINTNENCFCDVDLQVFRSIGYKSCRLDSESPFDEELALVPNNSGRVEGHPGN